MGQILVLVVFLARLAAAAPMARLVRRDPGGAEQIDPRVTRWISSTWWTVPAFGAFALISTAVTVNGILAGSGDAGGSALFAAIAVLSLALGWIERGARDAYLGAHPDFAQKARFHVVDAGGSPRFRPLALGGAAVMAAGAGLVVGLTRPASATTIGVLIGVGLLALALAVGAWLRARQVHQWSEPSAG